MRRTLAAAVLAAGMFAAATGCGDGDGDRSTEEICADLNATVDPLEAGLTAALSEAGLAAGQGDDAALAEAMVELNGIVGEVNTAVRDAAGETSDDEFRTALENFATELDNLAGEIEAGNVPDTQAVQAAGAEFDRFCG